MDINKIAIVGRLTRDPETSYTKNQLCVCKFSIAVNGMKKGNEDNVSFFNVTVWNKVAENCGKFLSKGSQVIIDGRLEQNRYTDKDGSNKSVVGITANQVQFIGKKDSQSQSNHDNGIPVIDDNLSIPADMIVGEDVPF